MTAGRAVALWALVMIALLSTIAPSVVIAGLMGALLVASTLRAWSLMRIGLIAGGSLVAINPLLASYGTDVLVRIGTHPVTGQAIRAGLILGARLAAVVMASSILRLVAPSDAYAFVRRLSPASAILGAIALRTGPQMRTAAARTREQLIARGQVAASGGSLETRLSGARHVWESVLAGSVDGAFATAAALEVRRGAAGSGDHARAEHPVSADRAASSAGVFGLIAIGAALVVIVASGLTGVNVVAPPSITTPGALTAGLLLLFGLGSCLGPARSVRDAHRRQGGLAVAVTALGPADVGPFAPDEELQTTALQRTQPIEIRDLRLRWPGAKRDVLAIDALDLAAGTCTVIVGASGSGKSTLVDALSGLAPGTTGCGVAGSIRIGGEQIAGCSPADRVAWVGAIFQDPERQVLTVTVIDDVAFGLRERGWDAVAAAAAARAELAAMGAAHVADRDPDTLSGGELQLVALASILVLSPAVLVLDEPTSQLDRAHSAVLWRALERARDAGVTVIAVEHRVDGALRVADRVIAIADGGIVLDRAISDDRDRIDVHRELVAAHPIPRVADWTAPSALGDGAARLTVRRLVPAAHGDGGRPLLQRPLDLTVPAGSILAITGANGAGKSTLLRALRGLHPATGDVRLDGMALDQLAVHRHVGYLGQSAAPLLAGSSVREELAAVLAAAGAPLAIGLRVIDAAGLTAVLDRHPMDLSVGQRERLAIVLAAAHQPQLLLLDEPTRGLDALARQWLGGLLISAARRGAVCVLVTHDAELTAALATHELRIEHGGAWQSGQLARRQPAFTGATSARGLAPEVPEPIG